VADTERRSRDGSRASEWRGRLAYASRIDGRSAVRLRILFRGKTTARTLPLPKTCAACPAWVESLDLGPRAVAFVWRNQGSGLGTDGEWNLQLDPLDGSRVHHLADGYVSGACGYVRPLLPTAVGVGAFWTAAGSSCQNTVTDFAEVDARSGRRRIARDSGHLIFGATRDDSATYWLRGDHVPDEDMVDMTTCEARGTDCVIVRASSLHWRSPGKRSDPIPMASKRGECRSSIAILGRWIGAPNALPPRGTSDRLAGGSRNT
jgi:hypothetical protein